MLEEGGEDQKQLHAREMLSEARAFAGAERVQLFDVQLACVVFRRRVFVTMRVEVPLWEKLLRLGEEVRIVMDDAELRHHGHALGEGELKDNEMQNKISRKNKNEKISPPRLRSPSASGGVCARGGR